MVYLLADRDFPSIILDAELQKKRKQKGKKRQNRKKKEEEKEASILLGSFGVHKKQEPGERVSHCSAMGSKMR